MNFAVILAENGITRQDSVLQGIQVCVDAHGIRPEDKLLIHEAVRPLVTARIIQDCLDALKPTSNSGKKNNFQFIELRSKCKIINAKC